MHTNFVASLLTRAGLAAVALLLLTAAYSNREFLTVFPFSLQTAFDVVLAGAFLYIAFGFDYCVANKKRFTRGVVGIALLYVVLAQAVSLWYYTHELGIDYIAESYGSFSWFLITQGALDVGVPAALLSLLYYGVHRYTTVTSS